MPPKEKSKWQTKSCTVNRFRWILEDILTKDLTPEDLKSEKYKELKETIRFTVNHALNEAQEKQVKAETKPKWSFGFSGFKNLKYLKYLKDLDKKTFGKLVLIAIAMSAGAILVQLIKILPSVLNFISAYFSNTPTGSAP